MVDKRQILPNSRESKAGRRLNPRLVILVVVYHEALVGVDRRVPVGNVGVGTGNDGMRGDDILLAAVILGRASPLHGPTDRDLLGLRARACRGGRRSSA